jgi:hypothetical protein
MQPNAIIERFMILTPSSCMLILLRCDDPFLVKLLVLLAGRRWLHPGTITISRLSRFAHLKNNSQRNQPADHCT